MIKLEETETKYLVSIPKEQRERAKQIRPRFWHNSWKKWVYPREPDIYRALIAEFGEDASVIEITDPESTPRSNLTEENRTLRAQLEEVLESLRLISQSTLKDRNQQVENLKRALMDREQSIKRLQSDIELIKLQLAKAKIEIDERISQQESLEQQLKRKSDSQTFEELLRSSAIETAGSDAEFQSILHRLSIDNNLPVELTREMESKFRSLLDSDNAQTTLFDLIMETSNAGALPNDAIDLAHIIRKQRNIIVHRSLHPRTNTARIVLCLFAAALLWPEFPD